MKIPHRHASLSTLLLAASLFLASCSNLPSGDNATATFDLAATMVVQTVDAQRTLNAAGQTREAVANPSPVPPTHTPRPTNTPLVIATDTYTPQPPTETPLVSDTVPPTLSDFYFEDDFEGFQGWAVADNDGFTMEYSGGSYRINVKMNTGDSPVFSVRSALYGDIRAEVDVIRAEGSEDNFFGLICRYQNTRNYYRLVVARDGYYNIGKKVDGEFIDLGSGTDEGAFNQGEDANHIQADCVGETLILTLNGTKLLEVSDVSFAHGGVGLVVGTRNNNGADIYFDNFSLSKP